MGRLMDGLLSDAIFITRTFLSKYQNNFMHKYHIYTFLRNIIDIHIDYNMSFVNQNISLKVPKNQNFWRVIRNALKQPVFP